MKKTLTLVLVLLLGLSLAACGSTDTAEVTFPTKQIHLICPLAAGGGSDAISRLYAAALEKELGVSVVVENKPGAGSGIGQEAIAASDRDGYTIGYIPAEVTTVKAMGNATVTPESFDFICTVMKICAEICVPADSEFETLEDLIAAAKANHGEITIGTAGIGNAYELGLRAMLESAGIELNIVNFSGGTAEAITAMMGGNVQCCTAGTAEALPYVKSGEFRLLCQLSAERSACFPDTPTATELGYPCDGGSWGAIAAPAGTDEAALKVLREASAKVLASEDFQKVVVDRGFDLYNVEPEQFAKDAMDMFEVNSGIIEKFNLSAN
jgi:tripartite-type tricarboxylate transporter receptor subunit TctC